ncbi:Acetyl esterase/lipase [Amycolatopsis pretoriensis]|uniref:Acetyl esterase/lipase n=1 Tax=Amycolatopsis pretoriensis TaxID=218821 RepID=A0A1H5QE93_9PSEU|nr:alpha/beta hydrolase [Amycolatopsis pretoriensis]SEF23718.1 Acetyl esterase/lipase [Amycolatopsis pretoriensis]
MAVIELTTFTVRPERTSAMLAARPGMLAAFREGRRGFVSAKLVRLDAGTWLDVVEWIDDTAWDESKAKGGDDPRIAEFFGTIDALVSSRRGARYDDPPGPVRTVAYGPHPAQVGELYRPAGEGPFPVVVLLHGGYWTAMFDRRTATPLADELLARGYAVWNVDYRRLGDDGGWPSTFEDVATAIDVVADLDPALDVARVAVIGHSAGGQLAAWAAHRPALAAGAVGADPKVVPVAVVSLAGVLDLVEADRTRFGTVLADGQAARPAAAPEPAYPEFWPAVAEGVGEGVVNLLLGGHVGEVPDRYATASPSEMGGAGVPVLALHGDADDVVPPAFSRTYASRVAEAEYVEVPGADHFQVMDPTHESWQRVIEWLTPRLH